MRADRSVPLSAFFLAAAFVAASASADSVCVKGYRDTTASERARMIANLEAVKRALPPAPPGWVIAGDDQVSVFSNLCMDYERKPWPYHFSRTYQSVDDYEQRQDMLRQANAVMQADLARKQPRLDALMAKQQEISKRQVAAFEKGDMTRALAMNEELAAVQAEYQKVMDEGDAKQQIDKLLLQSGVDQHMYISVEINEWAASSPGDGATTLSLPPGASSAKRWSRTGDVPQDEVQILFGRWRPLSNGGLALVARGDVPANFAHSVSVTVAADPGRIDSALAGIDFSALAKVLAP